MGSVFGTIEYKRTGYRGALLSGAPQGIHAVLQETEELGEIKIKNDSLDDFEKTLEDFNQWFVWLSEVVHLNKAIVQFQHDKMSVVFQNR